MSAGTQRYCRRCGHLLAAGAAFCRGCGAPLRSAAPAAAEPPEPPPPAEPPPERLLPPEPPPAPSEQKPKRRGLLLLLAALAVVCLGGAAAAAVVLLGGEDSEPAQTTTSEASTIPRETTATTRTEEASSAPGEAGAIGAGRYIQVGSYRSVAGAEEERERLEGVGVRTILIDSSEADELYPGFQVLVAGPFTDSAEEQRVLERLHENDVPSAFARPLTPAREITGPEGIVGRWTGTLERSGTGDEDLDGPLEVTLNAASDGQLAQLGFGKLNCQLDLTLQEAHALSLVYGQEGNCVGGGSWHLRPRGDELSLVLLPPQSEVIVLGVLDRR